MSERGLVHGSVPHEPLAELVEHHISKRILAERRHICCSGVEMEPRQVALLGLCAVRVFTKTEFWTIADIIPAIPGAYVLAVELSKQVAVSLCGKPSALLPPGPYLYCGSAKGPGGLRGRLSPHATRQVDPPAH
jgi:hypothetical protein